MTITIDTPEYRSLPVKDRFAVTYVTESLLFYAVDKFRLSCPEELREFSRSVVCERERILDEIPDLYTHIVRGTLDTNKMNGLVTSKVQKKFKDGVRADNEYGYTIYCKESVKDEVVRYIKKKFYNDPYVEELDRDERENPYFNTWTDAERYCVENDIIVVLPDFILEKVKKTKQVCFEVELENLKRKWDICSNPTHRDGQEEKFKEEVYAEVEETHRRPEE